MRLLIALFTLALVGCAARHTTPPVPLSSQASFGNSEDFGPGIVASGALGLDFVLDTTAQVIVLRVTNEGIEPVLPLSTGDRTQLGRGKHRVQAPEVGLPGVPGGFDVGSTYSACRWGSLSPYTDFGAAFDSTGLSHAAAQAFANCVRHEQAHAAMFGRVPQANTTAGPRTDQDDSYWLLIASDVTTGAEDLDGRLALMEWPGSALTAVRNLPEALVGGRTTRWAAYYVQVSNSPKSKRRK